MISMGTKFITQNDETKVTTTFPETTINEKKKTGKKNVKKKK